MSIVLPHYIMSSCVMHFVAFITLSNAASLSIIIGRLCAEFHFLSFLSDQTHSLTNVIAMFEAEMLLHLSGIIKKTPTFWETYLAYPSVSSVVFSVFHPAHYALENRELVWTSRRAVPMCEIRDFRSSVILWEKLSLTETTGLEPAWLCWNSVK